MDPISVGLTVISVIKAVSQVTTTIYCFIQDTKQVDAALKALYNEVGNLKKAVSAVEGSLQNATIRVDSDEELWSSVDGTLLECQKTCDELQSVLNGVHGTSSERGALRQAIKQLKLDWESANINSLRSRLRSDTMAMQLTLQLINVHVSSRGPEVVIAKLNPKLDVLIDMMAMFDPSKQEQGMPQSPKAEAGDGRSRNSRRLERVAKKVISNASVIFDREDAAAHIIRTRSAMDGSAQGSVLGESLTTERLAQIRMWNIESFTEEDEDSFEGSGRQEFHFSDKSAGIETKITDTTDADASPEAHKDDSDSEGDIAIELFDVLSKTGQRHYTDGNFSDAAKFFLKALHEASSISSKKISPKDRNTLNFKLAVAFFRTKNWEEAKRISLDLTQTYEANPDDPSWKIDEVLQTSHMLACAYMNLSELETAERICKRAMLGRRRVFGKGHASYFESIDLLISIYEAKGDTELALGYAALRPPKTALPKVPVQTAGELNLPEVSPKKAPSTEKSTEEASKKPTDIPMADGDKDTKHAFEAPRKPPRLPARRRPPSPPHGRKVSKSKEKTPNEKAIAILMKNGYDIFSAKFDPHPALLWAAFNGQEAALRILLEGTYGFSAPKSYFSVPPVMTMSPAVKNINFKNNLKETALHCAVAAGHEGAARILIEHRANLEHITKDLRTPLMIASEKEDLSMMNLLLQRGAKTNTKTFIQEYTALTRAIRFGRELSVRVLLDHGANLEAKIYDGTWRTPLALAAELGQVSIIHMLMDKGADPAPKRSPSAIGAAAENGRFLAVQALLERGVHVDTILRPGTADTALKSAARKGHIDVVRLLLDKGAKVEGSPESKGKTPLASALRHEHMDVARLLIEKGAIPRPEYQNYGRLMSQ